MNDLLRKIAAYFQQHPFRRVLFFFDADHRHTDEVAALTDSSDRDPSDRPATFELWRLDPPYPFFGMKVKLHQRTADALPVLLYIPGMESPRSAQTGFQDTQTSFPLLDLLVANDELRLDPVAEFMARHGLQPYQRSLVERYERELTRKDPNGLLQSLFRPEMFEEGPLQLGIIARLMDFKTLPDPTKLLAKLLTDRLERPADQANYLTKIAKLAIEAPLRRRIADTFFDDSGGTPESLTPGFVQQLVLRLKYNLIVAHLPAEDEPYPTLRLRRTDTLSRLTVLCEGIDAILLERLLVGVGEAVQEDKLLARYGTDARYGYYTLRLRERILAQVVSGVTPQTAGGRLAVLDGPLANLPKDQRNVGSPQQSLLMTVRDGLTLLDSISSIPTYRLDTPEAYIKAYEQTFYRIDTLYRWFIQNRRAWQVAADDQPNDTLSEAVTEWLSPFEQQIHERYDRFLLELNREWLACLKERDYDLRSIDVPKQYDFYRQAVVRPHLRDSIQKVAVLISDGLRYEIARDLHNELNQDAKSQATVGLMLTSLPSATWLGMANLLPHQVLQFDGQTVSINGQHTRDIEGRNAILKATNGRSQAIAYSALENMSKAELRDLFKQEVVYVYHNRIDDTGDKRQSEGDTVKAVRETIDELKRLIKNLHSQYNVARVLVTADHGFIYQHVAPNDLALVKAPEVAAKLEKNRYRLTALADHSGTNSSTTGSHIFSLAKASALTTETSWQVLVPDGVNRYRRQGSGTRYVHGGASLQEMLVPLLESSRKREEIGQKVTIRLVRDDISLLANQLKLTLLQEQRVTDTNRARTVTVGLYVGNELSSNRVELLFDSVSESASGRIRECTLHLTGNLPAQRQYTLRISDITDELNPLVERSVSNKTIIERDF